MEFDIDQAVCLTGCTRSQLRRWEKTGVFAPSLVSGDGGRAAYSFLDLVELRALKRMLDAGIGVRKVRRTLDFLREELRMERPLAQCSLVTDGSTVFRICEDTGQVMDTLKKGQLVFAVALGDIAAEISCRIRELQRDREEFISRLLQTDEHSTGILTG